MEPRSEVRRRPLLPPAWVLLVFMPTMALACSHWPQWAHFRKALISADGRVIDFSHEARITTSEGQAYALFFALVANDGETFDRLLTWTDDNLAGGRLGERLPAWLWGHADTGDWWVLDDNSASDADLWLAYTLLEAGRLWNRPSYRTLGEKLARLILDRETKALPAIGEILLPGAVGFSGGKGRWRLNPSYLPLPLLRYLGKREPRWQRIADNTLALLAKAAPKGFAPDWIAFHAGDGFVPDRHTRATGSYDAIRVYLWAGTLNPSDEAWPRLRRIFRPMRDHLRRFGRPPLEVDARTGRAKGVGPVGFSAALLPMLSQPEDRKALIDQLGALLADPPWEQRDRYYDQVLTLFGLGWFQRRYRFDLDGRLLLDGNPTCP